MPEPSVNAHMPAPGPTGLALLWRYLFFGWLFRDASQGSLQERRTAWRHNRACARWLPVYARRHGALGLLLFGLASALETLGQYPLVSAFFYVASILTVPVAVIAGVAWLGLKRLPPPN